MKRLAASLALALAALAPLAPAGAQARLRTVAPCTWSSYGDPRAVAHGDLLFTGCIDDRGRVRLDRYDLAGGERRLVTLFRGLEVDDHNNPSLAFFRSRLYAFASEHAGYVYPQDRDSRMRYRVSGRDFGRGRTWSRVRTVPLPEGCGLGYTYPNPVVSGGRLFLFMRGPCWQPYYTSTRDGRRWTAPRTLVLGPPGRGAKVRPYAKYDAAPDGSIPMTFSDGHPGQYENSLYYMRFDDGRFLRADGSVIGTVRDLPFRLDRLDVVQRYSARAGRASPLDVAIGADGAPVLVYTTRVGFDEDFRYARWDGDRWTTRLVAPAGGGAGLFGYRNGGITLDHADPRRVALSRLIDGRYEIEVRRTADAGRTWAVEQLTRASAVQNFRPVFPRGITGRDRRVVVYVSGTASSFRRFRTVVKMRIDAAAPGRELTRAG